MGSAFSILKPLPVVASFATISKRWGPARPRFVSRQTRRTRCASSRQGDDRATRCRARGLIGLGYEVTEGMSTTFVKDGRLVLGSAARPDYGVEISAAAGSERMQMRAVALEVAGRGPDPGRDLDAETIWCGDVWSRRDPAGRRCGIDRGAIDRSHEPRTGRVSSGAQFPSRDRDTRISRHDLVRRLQTSVLAAFNDIQSRVGNQKLWIGPNEHYFVYHRNFWPRDPYFAWFDYWLKGKPTGIMDEPPVFYAPRAWVEDREAYTPDDWRHAERWPPQEARPQRLYLRGDGSLGADGPGGPARHYRYDPHRPIPTAAKRERLAERGPLRGFVGTVSKAIDLIGQYQDAGVHLLITQALQPTKDLILMR
jgi:hypothetical protein